MENQQTVCVVGVGLIGGSLAISLKENGFAKEIIGVDQSQDNLDKAIRRRVIDRDLHLEQAIKESDIIILAIPVDAAIKVLPQILDQIDKQCVLDVGSTKLPIIEAIKSHPNRGRYVATHPMAGTEYSGPEAAIPNLFDHKATVFCNLSDSDSDAADLVQALYQSIPMHIVQMNAQEHDLHAAYVSHISHISSFALALTVLEKEKDENQIFDLASGGFRSSVRLAKSSPDMWTPIFSQNRDFVLDVLDEHINVLSRFRSLLIKRDFKTFYKLIEQANQIRKIID